jgi:predicted nucleic acid-binding Zn ribbon protein
VSTWQPSQPSPGGRDPRKLSELLDSATRRLGGPSSGTASAVFSGWEAIVGPEIAAHAQPVSLRHGVLVVAVDHPAWATQLRYMTAELLTRVAAAAEGRAAAEVRDIHIRVVGQPTPESPFRRAGRAGPRRAG